MYRNYLRFLVLIVLFLSQLNYSVAQDVSTAKTGQRYFGYEAAEDQHGVIAPWYKGLNGQCDFRIRVAAETMKRYPWADGEKAAIPAPEYIYNGHWQIDKQGNITLNKTTEDWSNGDLVQRGSTIINAMIDYYSYTGDAAALASIQLTADYIVTYGLTSEDHPWPKFPISVPVKGKHFRQSDPRGYIQLDIAAEIGVAFIRAYKVMGEERWLAAADHWAYLLAEHCNLEPGSQPWPRYANPEMVRWGLTPRGNIMTGGVAFVLDFLDELIQMGHTGPNGSYIEARNAGRAYLKDQLLPKWYETQQWGYNYWDNLGAYSQNNVIYWVFGYVMDNLDYFPNWSTDVRNNLPVHLNRTSLNPTGKTGVYSGAWTHPESIGCCRDSDSYGPQRLAGRYLQYAHLTGDEWAREMGRRQLILSTYDGLDNGVVIDGLLSNKPVVASNWFKIAHPMALRYVLRSMSWLPEKLAPNRENHLIRTSSAVQSVVYGDGNICYRTFDAPPNCVDVLRLAFIPDSVTADGEKLKSMKQLKDNGYRIKTLSNGDCIVYIRHDGSRNIVIEGDDPQKAIDDSELQYQGLWETIPGKDCYGGHCRAAGAAGAELSYTFTGNQVRLLGRFDAQGGKADVYLDGKKQLVGIDCWSPQKRSRQVLYYMNGMKTAKHTLKIVATGSGNPLSKGSNVYIEGLQYSAAEGKSDFGQGGGPNCAQRFLLGYVKRTDYVDSNGNSWRPSSEVVCQPIKGKGRDSVKMTWWEQPRAQSIANTADPELYRYGMHAPDFTVYFTVGPEKIYHVRIKLAETRQELPAERRLMNIDINGKEMVTHMDIAATAGGLNRAVDLVFNNIKPKNSVIAVRFHNPVEGEEAIAQAVEIVPGPGGEGAKPVRSEMVSTCPGSGNTGWSNACGGFSYY